MSLSNQNLAILACPADLGVAAPAYEWLSIATGNDMLGASFVAVNTKSTPPAGVSAFNVGGDYPSELAALATQAQWLAADGVDSPQPSHDATALFCLIKFVQTHSKFRTIVLITQPPPGRLKGLDEALHVVAADPHRPFHRLSCDEETSSPPLLFNVDSPYAELCLSIALDDALAGAIYAEENYDFWLFIERCMKTSFFINDDGIEAMTQTGNATTSRPKILDF